MPTLRQVQTRRQYLWRVLHKLLIWQRKYEARKYDTGHVGPHLARRKYRRINELQEQLTILNKRIAKRSAIVKANLELDKAA